MSLLNDLAQQAGSGFLANVFGTNNRSLQGDCLDISDVGSYAAKLAKYPQCAPFISGSGPITTAPVQAIPGSGQYPAPYTGFPQLPTASTVPISYQAPMLPAMAMLPQIGSMLPRLAPMLPAIGSAVGAVSTMAKKLLPVLNKNIALASGYIVTAGLVYTATGQLVGRVRRRRRINPLNYRAAMRAASRLCKVHDITARISQALPAAGTARAPRRRRRRKRC
jgi:hypothetical protein